MPRRSGTRRDGRSRPVSGPRDSAGRRSHEASPVEDVQHLVAGRVAQPGEAPAVELEDAQRDARRASAKCRQMRSAPSRDGLAFVQAASRGTRLRARSASTPVARHRRGMIRVARSQGRRHSTPRTRTSSATTRWRRRRPTTWPRPATTRPSTTTSAIRTCDIGRLLHGARATGGLRARARRRAARDRLRDPRRPRRRSRALRRGRRRSVAELFDAAVARGEACASARSATARSTRATSRSRRRATSIPTWSRAGCSAAAPSTSASAPLRAPTSGRVPRYEPLFRRLVLAHERLILPVMQSLLALPRLRSAPLRPRGSPRTNFGLRLNYYPPMSRGRRRVRRGAACSATRTSTCSRSCPRRASRGCRC